MGTHTGTVHSEGWTPCYGPILEEFLKNCGLWEAHAESVWKGLHPMDALEQGKNMMKCQMMKCYRLTTETVHHFTALLGRRR